MSGEQFGCQVSMENLSNISHSSHTSKARNLKRKDWFDRYVDDSNWIGRFREMIAKTREQQ